MNQNIVCEEGIKEAEEGREQGQKKDSGQQNKKIKLVGQGQKELTTNNSQVLGLARLCLEQNLLTKNQAQRWIANQYGYKKPETARRIITRVRAQLKLSGLVTEEKSLVWGKILIPKRHLVETLSGLGLITSRIRHRNFDRRNEIHDVQVTDIRLLWEKLVPGLKWQAERVIKPDGEHKVPDGVSELLSLKTSKTISLGHEVEMSQKSNSRYNKIFSYYQQGEYDAVFFYVPDDSFKDHILKRSKDHTNKVYVVLINDFLTTPLTARFVSNFGDFSLPEKFALKA